MTSASQAGTWEVSLMSRQALHHVSAVAAVESNLAWAAQRQSALGGDTGENSAMISREAGAASPSEKTQCSPPPPVGNSPHIPPFLTTSLPC